MSKEQGGATAQPIGSTDKPAPAAKAFDRTKVAEAVKRAMLDAHVAVGERRTVDGLVDEIVAAVEAIVG